MIISNFLVSKIGAELVRIFFMHNLPLYHFNFHFFHKTSTLFVSLKTVKLLCSNYSQVRIYFACFINYPYSRLSCCLSSISVTIPFLYGLKYKYCKAKLVCLTHYQLWQYGFIYWKFKKKNGIFYLIFYEYFKSSI